MADTLATSFGVLNYSGMLFNKGNTRCPLSSIIGGRAKTTNHVEFVTGQESEDQCDSDFSGVRRYFLCQAVQYGYSERSECGRSAG